ncbi:hypothetical protein C0Q70_05854 [Pomacea canaliculata]|uniref:Uncharacterized protein n=1 Tax=Pomacea canaliculata TaxID=400727 RepID=A0A2T7PMB5_POMCA|nr:hypothetical protein C0Q70_05854 [Pomacea canaliculata]
MLKELSSDRSSLSVRRGLLAKSDIMTTCCATTCSVLSTVAPIFPLPSPSPIGDIRRVPTRRSMTVVGTLYSRVLIVGATHLQQQPCFAAALMHLAGRI